MNADADTDDSEDEPEYHRQLLVDEQQDTDDDDDDEQEDLDRGADDGVPVIPRWMGFCYLCLVVGASVSSIWVRVVERQPPPEPPILLTEEEKEFEAAGQYLTAPRTFTLVVKPLVSAQDETRDKNLGEFYNESENRGYSLAELVQGRGAAGPLNNRDEDDIVFLRAVARLAMAWIEAEAAEIFHVISNVQYMGPLLDHYGEGYVSFLRMERDGDFIQFHLREVSPGSASLKFLRQLEEEVRNGGDTWACGDFGDVTYQIARRNRFAGLWESSLSFTDPTRVRMRVSFSTDINILDSQGNQIPQPEQQRCHSFDYYNYQESYLTWLPF